MKFCSRFISVFFLSVLLSTNISADEQPTPEERAFEFRDGLFHTFSWKMGQLYGAQAKEDEAAFIKHAGDLVALSSLLEEGFQIKDSIPEGSLAKPEIWQDYDSFKEKAIGLNAAAKGLTKEGAMANFNIRDFGSKNCGSCHRDFRVKKS